MKNIVIIVSDALRCKNLSLFGYEKETDKNLKDIAKESILFKQHFSPSNFTFPSIVSLFSGLYPNNHGLLHQFPYTKPEEITKFKQNKFWLPSYFKSKGYATIGIGWPGPWLKKGFDYFQEKEIEDKKNQSKIKKILRIPIIRKIMLGSPGWIYKFGKKIIKIRGSIHFPDANETMNLAISKIKNLKKPFFLYIHFDDTHFPFFTTKNPKSCGEKDINQILKKIKSKTQREDIKKRFADVKLNSLKDIENKYNLSIRKVDWQIGRFIKFLKKENLFDNTIFIFLADHGLNFGEHNIYFSSAGLFDETIHTPLIIRFPGFKSKEINELVQNVDIVPTILDYFKDETKNKIDGKSMIPLIKNKKPIRNKIFCFDVLAENVKAVRTKIRKLIIAEKNSCFLCKSNHHENIEEYDLKKDPKELKNIYFKESKLEKFLKDKNNK